MLILLLLKRWLSFNDSFTHCFVCLFEQLSPLAQLGHKAYTAMANGEAIDDSILIDIFIEEVKSLPEGTGWILDNFPTTITQAKVSGCGCRAFHTGAV